MAMPTLREYFAPSADGQDFAGVRRIPIRTAKGTFSVWTKRVGNNPRKKVLLLHGGPGGGHEFLEPLEPWLGADGVEYYHYDQLGSAFSDQPDDPDLWTMERFVDEVEQVRVALGLTRDNFYLFGTSWGGMLGIEYALAHGENLKGLIVANSTSSIPASNRYSSEVLARQMDPAAVAEIRALEQAGRFDDPRYMELLFPHYLAVYMCRLPVWPDGLNRALLHWNRRVREVVFGLGMLTLAGRLAGWDRSADLHRIDVPTLFMGSTYDAFDPGLARWMSTQVKHGSYHHCANGSHCAAWDDQAAFSQGLLAFLEAVDQGKKTVRYESTANP
jgi:proline iminopeptidase